MNWPAFLLGALLWASFAAFVRWRVLRRSYGRLSKSEAMYHHARRAWHARTLEEREFHLKRADEIYGEILKGQ